MTEPGTESSSAEPAAPIQHAYYHNFPSFCKEEYVHAGGENGGSASASGSRSGGRRVHHLKYIESRAADLKKLIHSLDITKIDFSKLEDVCGISAAALSDLASTENNRDNTADDDDDDDEIDELEYDDDNSDQEGDELLLEDDAIMEDGNISMVRSRSLVFCFALL
jgi:hypothetical protein